MLVFGVAFLGFSLTALVVQNLKATYTANAQIIFDDTDPSFIGSQKARLGSSDIAQGVIAELKLMNDPEFNVKVKPLQEKSKFKAIDVYNTKLSYLSGEIIAKEMQPVISRFREYFTAQIIPNSLVVNVEYKAHSPEKAAIILNEIIKLYLESLTPRTHIKDNVYETKIFEKLQENSKAAQSNFELLKSRIGQLKPKHNISEPSKEYGEAKSKYIKAKARLAPFLGDNKTALNSLTSPVIRKLKSRRNALKQRLSALSLDYGVKHPDIIHLKSQIADIDSQIFYKKMDIIDLIKADYVSAKSQLQSFPKTKINDNSNEYYNAFMRKKLKMLQEQAEETRRIFNDYKAIYKKSLEEEDEVRIPAKILSKVSVSEIASFPDKPKILAIGTLISFIFGLLLAIFVEKTRNSFLSARQVEEYLDIPCYALIPRVKGDKNKPLSRYVVDNPSSATSEAVRALKLVIKLCAEAKGRDCKVITVTSSLPNEGKTTLSSWIAQLAAKSGKRVILVDADLRRPSVHKSFGHPNNLSLAEYLSGQNKLEEVIDSSDPSGLHIIYGRSVPNSALDLISSDKMEQLIRSLRKAYDLVIIDSPACMAVSDARALEKLSDQLLYTVSWNKTSREIVHNGISQFTQFENAMIATVLTNIDLKKHVQLGYGEAVNYYGSYK